MAKNTIGNIALGLIANVNPFARSMKKGKKSVKKFGDQTADTAKTVRRFGAALVAVVASGALTRLISQQSKEIDSLGKVSSKLGIATEKLVALRFAAQETAGVTSQTFDTALQRLTRRVSEAAQGTGEAQNALKELRLDAVALSKLSPDQQFLAISRSMQEVANQGDRVRLSMRLFDTEGVALVNTLGQLRGSTDEYEEAARRLGLSLSRVDARKVEMANDAMGRISAGFTGFFRQLAIKFAPVLDKISTKFLDVVDDIGGMGKVAERVFDFILRSIGAVADAVQGLRILFEGFVVIWAEFGNMALTAMNNTVKGVRGVIGIFKHSGEIITGIAEVVTTAWESGWEATWDAIKVLVLRGIASIVKTLRGFLSKVHESLIETGHLPNSVHNAFNKANISLQNFANEFKKAADDIGEGKTNPVEEAVKRLGSLVGKIWEEDAKGLGFVESAISKLQQTSESAKSTISGLLQMGPASEQIKLMFDNVSAAFTRRATGSIDDPTAGDADLKAAGDHEKARQDIISQAHRQGMQEREKWNKMHWTMQAKTALGTIGDLTAGLAQHSRTWFEIHKGISIANAIINTSEGITKALSAYPPPLSFAMAGLQAAAGAAQIAFIASSSFNSSSPPPSPGGGGAPAVDYSADAVGAEAAGGSQVIRFDILGTGDRITRVITEEMQKAQARGTVRA